MDTQEEEKDTIQEDHSTPGRCNGRVVKAVNFVDLKMPVESR